MVMYRSTVDRRSMSSSRSSLHELDARRSSTSQPAATLSPRSREYLRLRVNARERQRMHDMNLALDALRRAMPYAQGPAVKKLSKMNTLLLARNYILLLTRTLDELRRLLIATSGGDPAGLTSRRHAQPDVDALRSFVVRDLNAEHQRYVDKHPVLFCSVCLCMPVFFVFLFRGYATIVDEIKFTLEAQNVRHLRRIACCICYTVGELHPLLDVPSYQRSTLGHRAFSVTGFSVSNSLPDELRDPSCTDETFQQSPKTFLFLFTQ